MKANKVLQAGDLVGESLQSPPNPPRRILVVEDEPEIRRINAMTLARAGYHVDTAEDGASGWEALNAATNALTGYDLLITDHNMPGMTGLALVKKLRTARMVLPVIMATGTLPMEELMDRYPWLQPVTTLLKPYSMEQLLGTVESILSASCLNRVTSNDLNIHE